MAFRPSRGATMARNKDQAGCGTTVAYAALIVTIIGGLYMLTFGDQQVLGGARGTAQVIHDLPVFQTPLVNRAMGMPMNVAGTNVAGTNVGGTNVAGTNAAGTNVGGSDAAGTNVGGSDAAGTNVAGSDAAAGNLDVPPPEKSCETSDDAVNDLITQPARLHGFVDKAGMLTPETWHSSRRNSREEQRRKVSWNLAIDNQETSNGKSLFGGLHPTPGGCFVLYNDDYKYIYLLNTKTGSSSVFTRGFGGICGLDSNRTTCGKFLTEVSLEQAQTKWNDYFVFTFVRNPFTRASSCYNFLQKTQKVPDGPKDICTVPWKSYFQNPNAEVLKCKLFPQCCKLGERHASFHIIPQAPCSLTADGRPAADFVGRQESSFEDYEKIAAKINEMKNPDVPPLNATLGIWENQSLQKTEIGKGEASSHLPFYTGDNKDALKKVKDWYWMDFKYFQFDTSGMDSMCL